MPPKKQEEEKPSAVYTPVFILPIFKQASAQSLPKEILLSKPINVKKSLNQEKIVELLKEKGLEQHLDTQGKITSQGRAFICENLKVAAEEFISQVSKPADPKKDATKKDSKKDPKKEEAPVEDNKQPTIQLDFEKRCSDFFFYLDFPSNPDELRKCIENDAQIDIVVVIDEKVRKGSKTPDYSLLGKNLDNDILMETLNNTKISSIYGSQQSGQIQSSTVDKSLQREKNKSNKKMLDLIKSYKNERQDLENVIILEINYEKDLSSPEEDEMKFINNLFAKISETTVDKERYEKWKEQNVHKVTPMIEPLKEVIKKEVAVESQDKKGKKEANKEPEVEIVEEVIEKRYESQEQNIKSDLKVYKTVKSLKNQSNSSQFGIKQFLNLCLQSSTKKLDSDQSYKNSPPFQDLILQNLDKANAAPAVKLNDIERLKKNLRNIQYFQKEKLVYDLIQNSQRISREITFEQILHRDPNRKDLLQTEYILRQFTKFMEKQEPKIRWDFSDRQFREKLTKQKVISQIQEELLFDPKTYQAKIEQDNLKLLCLAKLNPPGRLMFCNDIFDWKAVPSFEEWVENCKSEGATRGNLSNFYDYRFAETGSLSIKREKMMPADNTVITDEKVSIGNQSFKVNYFENDQSMFGVRRDQNGGNNFWLSKKKQNFRVSIFLKDHIFKKTSLVAKEIQQQGSEEVKVLQEEITTEYTQKQTQFWIVSSSFTIGNDPYPSISWLSSCMKWKQKKRVFGPKGQITCYMMDGSIRILYSQGNVSTFRNNEWEHIEGNTLISRNGSERRQLTFNEIVQGDKVIRVREDQTIFIALPNGNTLIDFGSDNTRIHYDLKTKTLEIHTFNPEIQEEFVVRITPPRKKNMNVIGHGSAFSYLGERNILERSYDGFLYEIWNGEFSSHLYIEKYEHEKQVQEEEVRIIHLIQDGEVLKTEASHGKVILVQGNESPHQNDSWKWNQLFTSEDNHQQGVYDVDLRQGYIKTRDSESNQFMTDIDQDNKADIAVSFKIDEDEPVSNRFGSGFHVPEENYFLPAPENRVPPRLFAFDLDNECYYQFLNKEQTRTMQNARSEYFVQETSLEDRLIKQFTKVAKKKKKLSQIPSLPFSKTPQLQCFSLPTVLLSKQTRVNMPIDYQSIIFRELQKLEWSSSFQNVNEIEVRIRNFKEERKNQLKVLTD